MKTFDFHFILLKPSLMLLQKYQQLTISISVNSGLGYINKTPTSQNAIVQRRKNSTIVPSSTQIFKQGLMEM